MPWYSLYVAFQIQCSCCKGRIDSNWPVSSFISVFYFFFFFWWVWKTGGGGVVSFGLITSSASLRCVFQWHPDNKIPKVVSDFHNANWATWLEKLGCLFWRNQLDKQQIRIKREQLLKSLQLSRNCADDTNPSRLRPRLPEDATCPSWSTRSWDSTWRISDIIVQVAFWKQRNLSKRATSKKLLHSAMTFGLSTGPMHLCESVLSASTKPLTNLPPLEWRMNRPPEDWYIPMRVIDSCKIVSDPWMPPTHRCHPQELSTLHEFLTPTTTIVRALPWVFTMTERRRVIVGWQFLVFSQKCLFSCTPFLPFFRRRLGAHLQESR